MWTDCAAYSNLPNTSSLHKPHCFTGAGAINANGEFKLRTDKLEIQSHLRKMFGFRDQHVETGRNGQVCRANVVTLFM